MHNLKFKQKIVYGKMVKQSGWQTTIKGSQDCKNKLFIIVLDIHSVTQTIIINIFT